MATMISTDATIKMAAAVATETAICVSGKKR